MFAIALAPSLAAQVRRAPTIGQLFTTRVDTIEIHRSVGGELGRRTAHLLLTRTDSGFAGVLRLSAKRFGGVSTSLECGMAKTSYVPRVRAERVLTLIDGTVIDSGAAPQRLRVYDVWWDDWIRLSGQGDFTIIRDRRTLQHGELAYHPVELPVRRGERPKEDHLEQANRILDEYLQWDRLDGLVALCLKQ